LHQILKIDAIAATYCIIFVFDARGRDAIGSKFSSECYYYDDDYHALLTTRLASVGNLEACFLTGLRLVFMEAYRSDLRLVFSTLPR
jgi:hypothetical protein